MGRRAPSAPQRSRSEGPLAHERQRKQTGAVKARRPRQQQYGQQSQAVYESPHDREAGGGGIGRLLARNSKSNHRSKHTNVSSNDLL